MKKLCEVNACFHRPVRQRGAVLFFALIALVVMTLAAIALVRSVDTTTLIAGNLAFKQSGTSSADGGVEAAMNWVAANAGALDSSLPASGYYNSLNQARDLTALNWSAANTSTLVGVDQAGNSVRYIIQRMCSHPVGAIANLSSGVAITPAEANCLFSDAEVDTGGKGVLAATEAGRPSSTGGSPIYRVTAQVTGPRNTVSYVQAFVY